MMSKAFLWQYQIGYAEHTAIDGTDSYFAQTQALTQKEANRHFYCNKPNWLPLIT